MTLATTKIITGGLLGEASKGLITSFFSLFIEIAVVDVTKRAGRAGVAGGTVYERPRRREDEDEDDSVYNVIIKLRVKSQEITTTYQVNKRNASYVVTLLNIINATKRTISITLGSVQHQLKRLVMAVKSIGNRDNDK